MKTAVEKIITEIDNEVDFLKMTHGGAEVKGRLIGLAFAKRVALEAKEMEKEQQIKFAKFHVESALKTASEEACTKYIPFSDDVEVDSNSILESYPLENIK